ncbi:MAG: DUF2797 domain-containing protein [Pseudomonadales bacterium]
MAVLIKGALSKMRTEWVDGHVVYHLDMGEQSLCMNDLLGQQISLEALGDIHCTHCGRKTKKSFSQGYCYPCFKALPQCDLCIMSPEKCHFHLGTCRDEQWGEQFCFNEHIVYLANSSAVKVGITRVTQVPTRWMDQGAIAALPIFRVQTRRQSGLIERIIGQHISDKTNWRKMLKGESEALDLKAIRDELLALCKEELDALTQEQGIQNIQPIEGVEVLDIDYPVQQYPSKITSHNLDKTPLISGTLQGIKGQYLILDTGVINLRKYTAYNAELATL